MAKSKNAKAVLANIAVHYGIDENEAAAEVIGSDSEKIYDYMTAGGSVSRETVRTEWLAIKAAQLIG